LGALVDQSPTQKSSKKRWWPFLCERRNLPFPFLIASRPRRACRPNKSQPFTALPKRRNPRKLRKYVHPQIFFFGKRCVLFLGGSYVPSLTFFFFPFLSSSQQVTKIDASTQTSDHEGDRSSEKKVRAAGMPEQKPTVRFRDTSPEFILSDINDLEEELSAMKTKVLSLQERIEIEKREKVGLPPQPDRSLILFFFFSFFSFFLFGL
jgi:hypothetical protein